MRASVVSVPATDSTSSGAAPPPAKRNKLKVTKWRPSKSETRESFVTQISNEESLKKTLSERHQQLLKQGITPQPYVVIVGEDLLNVVSYYVVLNPDVFYNCPGILAAVDACFKMKWALNLQYPPCSYAAWLFLQRGLYKMSSPDDNVTAPVESLVTDCRRND